MADEHKNVPRCGTETEGMMPSKYDIIRMISEFNHDPILHKLRKFLDHKNLFDILGISRKEVNHSGFLAWLFNSTQDHGLGALPTSRLLDFMAGDIVSHFDIRKNHEDGLDIDYHSNLEQRELVKKILFHDYRVISSTSLVEQSTDKNKRIDILVKCNVRIGGVDRRINIVIENKVDSDFHDDQLNNYSRHIEKHFKDSLNLYALIAPDTGKALESLKPGTKNRTGSKEANQYVPISYQELLSEVISPSLAKQDIPVRTRVLIEEYIHELSKPNMENNITIMAMEEKESDLLLGFLDTHHELLDLILTVVSNDSNIDAKKKKSFEEVKNIINRRYSKYYLNGELYNKAHLPAAIVRSYVETKDPDVSISEMRRLLGFSEAVLKDKEPEEKDVKAFDPIESKSWYVRNDRWTDSSLRPIIHNARIVGIDVQSVEPQS